MSFINFFNFGAVRTISDTEYIDLSHKEVSKSLFKNNGKISIEKQYEYFEKQLSLVGLSLSDSFIYFNLPFDEFSAKKDMEKTCDIFFSFVCDLLNYFIAEYTYPEIAVTSRSVFGDASDDGDSFSLHYIDEKNKTNISAFSFKTLFSSGIIDPALMSNSFDWKNDNRILFEEYHNKELHRESKNKNEIDAMDVFVLQYFTGYIPKWKNDMKIIGRY